MTRRQPKPREGFDGTVLHIRERPIPGTRQVQQTITRCQPGSFEWRYGRARPGTELDMLYHAGVEFGRIWENLGLNEPHGVDWLNAGGSSWRSSLPLSHLIAMEELKPMLRDLGKVIITRLRQYVVEGYTSRQIAASYGTSERNMAIVLASDLKAAAVYFRYEES